LSETQQTPTIGIGTTKDGYTVINISTKSVTLTSPKGSIIPLSLSEAEAFFRV